MSENSQQVDAAEADNVRYIDDNMQIALGCAVEAFPDSGVCLFLFYNADGGARIAQMSNMDNPQLLHVLKEWFEHQEKPDERDRHQ